MLPMLCIFSICLFKQAFLNDMTTLLQIRQSLCAERVHQKKYKTKLTKASGVHRNTLSGLEVGAPNVGMNTLIALCNQLGLDIVLVRKEVANMVPTDGELQSSALSRVLANRLRRTTSTGDS
jgi:hypothetical protein